MTNAEIRAYARECIKGNLLRLCLPELFVLVVTAALEMLSVLNVGLNVIPALLGIIFSVGLASIYISAARKSYIQFSDVFCGFDQLGRVILTNLYAALWIILKMLLLIVPGIIEAYALSLVPYVRADDPDIGVREACARSRWLMEGRKLDLFLLELSFFPWVLLAIATLGIGFIYVLPYYSTARAAFYESILADEQKEILKSADPADNSASDI